LCVKIEFLRIYGNSEVPSALEDCAKFLSKTELLVLARCGINATSVQTLANAIDSLSYPVSISAFLIKLLSNIYR